MRGTVFLSATLSPFSDLIFFFLIFLNSVSPPRASAGQHRTHRGTWLNPSQSLGMKLTLQIKQDANETGACCVWCDPENHVEEKVLFMLMVMKNPQARKKWMQSQNSSS